MVHFEFWRQTLAKWANEGHITKKEAKTWFDSSPSDKSISKKLGFDVNFSNNFSPFTNLFPFFRPKLFETFPDGKEKRLNKVGRIRDILGVEGKTYIFAEDYELFTEIINTSEPDIYLLQYFHFLNTIEGKLWK